MTMIYARTIAIDGPAASGKSTIGAILAERLNYVFVDAGVIYRAITETVLQAGVNPEDEARVRAIAQSLPVEVRGTALWINGREAGEHYYTETINQVVPVVAALPGVREAVRAIQSAIAVHGNVVFAGRDIGTVVLPNADLKLFLQASLEERVDRRYAALSAMDPAVTRDHVLADLQRRDEMDSTRSESPIRIAPDAIVMITDGLSVEATLERVMKHALTTKGVDLRATGEFTSVQL
jgi:cytidylate kinase